MMTRASSIVFALALSAGIITGMPCVCADVPMDAASASTSFDNADCGSRYNAMIATAKSALMSGDRAGALRSLVAARAQLHRCQENEEENATGATALALSEPPAAIRGCL